MLLFGREKGVRYPVCKYSYSNNSGKVEVTKKIWLVKHKFNAATAVSFNNDCSV